MSGGSHLDELLQAFGATDADLAANRVGRLGPDQARRLRRSAVWNIVGGAFIAGVLLVVLLTLAERPYSAVQVALVIVLGGGGLLLGVRAARGLLVGVRAGTVERCSGPVTTGTQRNQSGAWLRVGDQHLHLPIHESHVLAGESYEVYVLPRTSRVVLIEPVPPVSDLG